MSPSRIRQTFCYTKNYKISRYDQTFATKSGHHAANLDVNVHGYLWKKKVIKFVNAKFGSMITAIHFMKCATVCVTIKSTRE